MAMLEMRLTLSSPTLRLKSEARTPLMDERRMINRVEASQKQNMNRLIVNRLLSVMINARAANRGAQGVMPARSPSTKGERVPLNIKQ